MNKQCILSIDIREKLKRLRSARVPRGYAVVVLVQTLDALTHILWDRKGDSLDSQRSLTMIQSQTEEHHKQAEEARKQAEEAQKQAEEAWKQAEVTRKRWRQTTDQNIAAWTQVGEAEINEKNLLEKAAKKQKQADTKQKMAKQIQEQVEKARQQAEIHASNEQAARDTWCKNMIRKCKIEMDL